MDTPMHLLYLIIDFGVEIAPLIKKLQYCEQKRLFINDNVVYTCMYKIIICIG